MSCIVYEIKKTMYVLTWCTAFVPKRVFFEFLFQYLFRSSGKVRRYNTLGSVYAIRHFSLYIILCVNRIKYAPLQWRHNERDGVSNHQRHDCLLKRLFRREPKKTSKFRGTGLCEGNSPGPVNSPHKGPWMRKIYIYLMTSSWHVQNPLFCLDNAFSVLSMYPCSSWLHYRNCDKTQRNTQHFSFAAVIYIYIYYL